MIVRNETLFRDVISSAAKVANGRSLMLSANGTRDLLGEALHMIGVSDEHLRDNLSTVNMLIAALLLSTWIRAGVAWDRGDRGEAVRMLTMWAEHRTVRQIRELLTLVGRIPLEPLAAEDGATA